MPPTMRIDAAPRYRVTVSAGETTLAWNPNCDACVGALATVDLLPRGRDDPPRSAELVDALARRLARFAIGHEVVEGVAAVGDLLLAVHALRRSEERRVHAGTCNGLAAREQRRPQ